MSVTRFGDEDRATMLADFGLRVVYGTRITWGILDEEERIETDDAGTQILVRETVLLVSAKDFETGHPLAALVHDETLTVAGVSYGVRDIRAVDDGAFKQLVLARDS